MATVSWGKPTIEICKLIAGELPANPNWIQLQTPVTDSSTLKTEKGEKKEIILEGGEVYASKYSKNKYNFECKIPVGAGDSKAIEDEDGIINDEYAIRLTPENETAEGWKMDRVSVSSIEGWNAKEGAFITYAFDGMKPKTGKILKPYIANGLVITPSVLYFGNTADTAGKAVTITSTTNPTASSSESWCTVAVAAKVVTVKVTANSGTEARSAVVTVTADGKTSRISVMQVPV